MTAQEYKMLKEANDKYNAELEKNGFTSYAESLNDSICWYCFNRGISVEEFNKYFN